ncbi:MAG: Pyridoxamine 5-phosphate oxidase [uncultured Sulfurovum sp.]|uniref:Pyridoxamine 5-phosphate oxidase n=1 Tax=uncultured Sulfurovum sp. TaxID=269237 RepID=A0A6S6T7J4_9BACT|nr:MAG: Pyridoxamine 5-phosphate oxidase [uncultured Sulfurovum sp.]
MNAIIFGSHGEKRLQQEFNTTQDALKFYNKRVLGYLAPLMQGFIRKQEMMFISTADSKGECDSSVRFGETGFAMVVDDRHIIYPEFKGNGVMASMGNIAENPHIGLLFIDFFETKVGLHVNGKAKIIRKESMDEELSKFNGLAEKLRNHKMKFKSVSYILIEVEEAYIHCSLHIPILQKVEDAESLETFPKGKGGDAFKVESLI